MLKKIKNNEDWKKFKKVANEKTKVPMWVFYIIGLAFLGAIMFANIDGHDEGYWQGYNDAEEHSYEQYQYEIWLTYDYETRQESFWSTIMWDVTNNSKVIFMWLVVILILWAVRF